MAVGERYKEYVDRGEAVVERLVECPLPLRIHHAIALSPSQINTLGLDGVDGIPQLTVVRDTLFQMFVYGDKVTGEEHIAVMKDTRNGEDVPVRVHSSCLTAESFHASNCDCHGQLQIAMNIADNEGFGGVVWLHQEGRGNGLVAKAEQLALIVGSGLDTLQAYQRLGYPVEKRDFTPAADILKDLGIRSIRMITGNPYKIAQIEELGIVVNERIPCVIPALNDIMKRDFRAKRDGMGYLLDPSI